MRQGFFNEHRVDVNGNPAGGVTTGKGFTISWQDGPLGHGADSVAPNGAFVEDIIDAAAARIRFYQSSKFACIYNTEALAHLEAAGEALSRRTRDRERRSVEGTHNA